MNEEPSSSENELFSELVKISERIQSGIKGKDILVLENDDEMNGYNRTPMEAEFCSAVARVLQHLEERGATLLNESPGYGAMIIMALVQAQSAADAYRSRMFRYATDWGSEISPVGGCQRELFVSLREILSKLQEESRKKMYDALPGDLKSKYVVTYYWTEFDNHTSESTRVVDLFSF